MYERRPTSPTTTTTHKRTTRDDSHPTATMPTSTEYSALYRSRDLAEDPAAARAKAAAAKRAYREKKKAAEQPPPLSPEEERAAAEEERAAVEVARAAALERYYQTLDERAESLAAITELLTDDPAAVFDVRDYPSSEFISAQTMLTLYRGGVPRPLDARGKELLREEVWAAVAHPPKPIARGGFNLERMAKKQAEREAYHARQAQGGEA